MEGRASGQLGAGRMDGSPRKEEWQGPPHAAPCLLMRGVWTSSRGGPRSLGGGFWFVVRRGKVTIFASLVLFVCLIVLFFQILF